MLVGGDAAAILALLADHSVRAVGLVEQVEDRGTIARGLGRDDLVSRIEASLRRSHWIHLEGVGHDRMLAVEPVVDRAVRNIQVADLLRACSRWLLPSPDP